MKKYVARQGSRYGANNNNSTKIGREGGGMSYTRRIFNWREFIQTPFRYTRGTRFGIKIPLRKQHQLNITASVFAGVFCFFALPCSWFLWMKGAKGTGCGWGGGGLTHGSTGHPFNIFIIYLFCCFASSVFASVNWCRLVPCATGMGRGFCFAIAILFLLFFLLLPLLLLLFLRRWIDEKTI